ncbi:cytidine deaminase [Gracilimonas sp.]|uniref:cytidine deaminase n=1 Tax=Gracilimonas sp. TaxID=1974203 RepID=UPI003BA88353
MSWKPLYENSYVPYSSDKEACVVESKSGKYYAGVRIENISYPLTIPAVQAACAICLSEGEIPAKIYIQDSSSEQLDYWVGEFNLEIIETKDPPVEDLEDLYNASQENLDVLSRLKSLLDKAVAPNSDFPVSAILFTEDGYFEGVNVEVSAWTHGICAERVAISKAFVAGYTEFTRLEVHTRKGEISSPCGACRQVISELLPYHDIILHHSDGTQSEHLTLDLLPFSFKSSALKR